MTGLIELLAMVVAFIVITYNDIKKGSMQNAALAFMILITYLKVIDVGGIIAIVYLKMFKD